jgi:hypothetical protein
VEKLIWMEMGYVGNLKLGYITKNLFTHRAYKYLNRALVTVYILFFIVYMLRDKLYKLDVEYIMLFAWTAPNLIPSFLFTVVGVFYIMPAIFTNIDVINKSRFIWLINLVNLSIFALIEYLHVILNLAVWDNEDMIASLIGTLLSTIACYKWRGFFVSS